MFISIRLARVGWIRPKDRSKRKVPSLVLRVDSPSEFHTIPLRNSSNGYFVPRHTMPSFERVSTIERNRVYMKRLALTGCRKK